MNSLPESHSKSHYREILLEKILSMPLSERTQSEQNIFKNLAKVLTDKSGYWGAYQPLKSEPHIQWEMLQSKIQWCFPQTSGSEMNFITDVKEWKKSVLNVLEPQDGKTVSVLDLKGICIPGLGFQIKGQRLGRGAGFFDRTLAGYTGLKLGLCFDFCLKSDLPVEAHDIKMDYIITDKQVVKLV